MKTIHIGIGSIHRGTKTKLYTDMETTETLLGGSLSCSNDSSPVPKDPTSHLAECLKLYHVLSESERLAIGSICFLAGPLTLLENLLVLGLICCSPVLRRRASYLFIASIALADTCASCFYTISFLDFHLFQRCDDQAEYLFKLGGVTMSFTASVGSLLLTALDRYLCIYQASSYKVLMTRQRALQGLVVLWAMTMLLSFLPLMGWRCPTQLQPPCSRLFPYVSHLYLASWVSFVLLLLLLIVVSYALILWKANRHEALVSGLQQGPVAAGVAATQGGQGQARMRMDIHLARTLSLILLVMVGCWLPALSFMLADVAVVLSHDQQRAFAFCSTLCLVNSSVNPLLYALRCRELRRELRRVLCHATGRLCAPCGLGNGTGQDFRGERSNCSIPVDNEGDTNVTGPVLESVSKRVNNTAEQLCVTQLNN